MTHEVDDFGFPIEHEAPDQVAIVVPSSWRSVDPGLFRAVTDQLRRDWAEMLGLDDPSDLPFNATETGHILNEFAEVYRLENGQFPAFYDAVTATGEIWNRFTRRTTGADLLPYVYKTDNGDGTFNFFENSARSSGPVLMAMATPVDLDGGVTEIPVASNTAVSSRSRNRDQAADDGFGSATREEFLNRRGFGGATM